MRVRSAALLILATVASMAAQAAPTAKAEIRAKGRERADASIWSRMKPEAKVGYSLNSDFNEQTEPRALMHRLSAGVTTTYQDRSRKKDLFYFGADVAIAYDSFDTEIVKDQGSFFVQDVDVYAGKTFGAGKWWGATHTFDLSGGNSFPLSEQSRYEGYKAVPGASGTLVSTFLKGLLSFRQTLDAQYVWNTFSYSPVSLETNPDYSASYAVGLTGKPAKGLKVSVGASVKTTHHLDGTNTITFGNSQSVSYEIDRYAFALKYANGGHSLADRVDLWFIDRYRQLLTFNASVRF